MCIELRNPIYHFLIMNHTEYLRRNKSRNQFKDESQHEGGGGQPSDSGIITFTSSSVAFHVHQVRKARYRASPQITRLQVLHRHASSPA